jgi:hypothetical protein
MEQRIKSAIADAIHTPEFSLHVGFGSRHLAEELSLRVIKALGIRVCHIHQEIDPMLLATDELEAGDYIDFTERQMLAALWDLIQSEAVLRITHSTERAHFSACIDMAFPAITKLG